MDHVGQLTPWLQDWLVEGLVPAPSVEQIESETVDPDRLQVTVLVCVPPDPHVTLQDPQLPVDHAAQACELHEAEVAGLLEGQSGPKHEVQTESETVVEPRLHTTVLVCVPPPHVAEQVP